MKRILALAFGFLVSACAVQGPQIHRGESLSVVVHAPAAPLPIETSNAAIKENAGTGLAGGAVVGALVGLGCGPLLVLCVPLGAVVYGAAGTVLGAGVGVAEDLPADTREQLERRLEEFARAHDVHGELSSAVMQRATGHWMIVPRSASSPSMAIRLEQATVRVLRGRASLLLRARVVLERPAAGPFEKTFQYLGPASDVSLWIEDRADFVQASFRDGYAFLAQSVIGEFAR
jgi:hypothetical protein